MSRLDVHVVPCLADNYGLLLHDAESDTTAAIDTPDATAITAALDQRGWRLTHILNTHHHHDHTGGNAELKKQSGCRVVGPLNDAQRIPGLDQGLADGDEFALGAHRVQVLETPGHTLGHVVYYLPDEGLGFVGDTLFAMGCGRLFEGTPEQMWHSLQKLLEWPDDTLIYCAHEYTEANGRFALSVEPGNEPLAARMNKVRQLREQGKPTVPTTMAVEKATNPFLRPWSSNLRATIGMEEADDSAVFARTRALKDEF